MADLIGTVRDAGIPAERTAIGGFSQGACLAAEFVARNALHYGGLFVLSGALLGPPDTPRDYPGSLEGTPVFVGGCDGDPWVGAGQLSETADVMRLLGAEVRLEIRHGSEHTIRPSETDRVREIVLDLLPS